MRKALLAIPFVLGAAVWAQSTDSVDDLIKKLGHDDYAVREEATKKLIELKDKAAPALEKALQSEDLEVRLRAGRALRAIRGNGAKATKPDEAEPAPTPRPGVRFGRSSSGIEIQFADGKVRVKVREMVDGKVVEKTYEGASLDEIKKKHPELKDKLGGMRLHVGGANDPFDMDKFWRDWARNFNDDWMRRWRDDAERDMQRMRRWMDMLETQRRKMAEQALAGRPVPSGRLLGVRARRPEAVLDAQLQLRGRGLVLDAVEKGTLADTLGLKRFDILLRLNGTDIRSTADIARVLQKHKQGDKMTALVIRRAKQLPLEAGR